MESKAELRILFEKYLDNTCSKKELDVITAFVTTKEGEHEWSLLLDEFWKKNESESDEADQLFPSGYKEEVFRKLIKRAHQNQKQIPLYPQSSFKRNWMRIAAAIVFLLIATVVVYQYQDSSPPPVKYFTKVNAKGQKSTIALSDGSTVRLNSESTLTYPEKFNDELRELSLDGEAFFMVSKNPKRPFVVNSGDLKITVLGTSFNIKAFPDENIEVTVATGKVAVAHDEKTPNKETSEVKIPAAKKKARFVLHPKQQIVFDKSEEKFKLKEVEIAEYLAWKDGILKLDNKSFSEAVKDISRWYGIQIQLENKELGNCLVHGEYKDESLLNLMRALSYSFDITYEIKNDILLIKGKGCD